MSDNKSLKSRILSAKTEASIEKLLAEGADYEFARDTTRGKWKQAASERRVQLREPKEARKGIAGGLANERTDLAETPTDTSEAAARGDAGDAVENTSDDSTTKKRRIRRKVTA